MTLVPVDSRQWRALQIGIAASIALHALALFVTPGIRAPKIASAPPSLTAVLRLGPPSPEPAPGAPDKPEAVTPPRPPVEKQPPPVQPPRPPAESRPVLTAPPTPSSPPVAPVSAQPAPAAPPAAAPAAVTATTETKTANAAPGGAGAGTATNSKAASAPPVTVASAAPSSSAISQEGVDPSALEGYKIGLANACLKYKVYPREALEKQWEGIPEIKVTIGANGHILDVTIAKSSGYELLDKAAIATVRKAAPLAEIKAALRNKEFSVVLPFVYNIEHKG